MSGLKFLLLFIAIIAIVAVSKFVLRKVFNIKKVKKKAFSHNHINSTHRKVDWAVRITALTVYLILAYQLYFHEFLLFFFYSL